MGNAKIDSFNDFIEGWKPHVQFGQGDLTAMEREREHGILGCPMLRQTSKVWSGLKARSLLSAVSLLLHGLGPLGAGEQLVFPALRSHFSCFLHDIWIRKRLRTVFSRCEQGCSSRNPQKRSILFCCWSCLTHINWEPEGYWSRQWFQQTKLDPPAISSWWISSVSMRTADTGLQQALSPGGRGGLQASLPTTSDGLTPMKPGI